MEFDDLDALRGHVRQRMEDSQLQAIARMQKGLIVKGLIEAHEFDPPESYVDSEIESMMAQERSKGLATPQEEGKEGKEFDEKAKREELMPEAVNRSKATVMLDIIGEREKIEVLEDDMKSRIIQMSMEANTSPENLMKYYVAKDGSLEGLRQAIFEEKVLDAVLSKAEREPEEKSSKKAEKK